VQIPTTRGQLYDAFYDAHSRKWIEWSAIVPEYTPPAPFEFSRILVPTTDSVLYTWMLSRLVGTEKPVLFVGESGTAKTVTIQNFLSKELQPEKFNVLNINFSSRTTSRDVQVSVVATQDACSWQGHIRWRLICMILVSYERRPTSRLTSISAAARSTARRWARS